VLNVQGVDQFRLITGTDLMNEQATVGVAGSPIVARVAAWNEWGIFGVAGVLGQAGGPPERFASLDLACACLAQLGVARFVVQAQ
jgi:hypothetical protein